MRSSWGGLPYQPDLILHALYNAPCLISKTTSQARAISEAL